MKATLAVIVVGSAGPDCWVGDRCTVNARRISCRVGRHRRDPVGRAVYPDDVLSGAARLDRHAAWDHRVGDIRASGSRRYSFVPVLLGMKELYPATGPGHALPRSRRSISRHCSSYCVRSSICCALWIGVLAASHMGNGERMMRSASVSLDRLGSGGVAGQA